MNDSETDSEQTPRREPAINIPLSLLFLLLSFVAVHLFYNSLLPLDKQAFIVIFSFLPSELLNGVSWLDLFNLISFQFIHGNWTHLIINSLGLLAFGVPVLKKMGVWRFFLFFLTCGVAGALSHAAVEGFPRIPLIGASAGISGVFAAVLRVMQSMGSFPTGLKGLLPVTVIWIVMNWVSAVIGMPGVEALSIAWIAHIGGYFTGLLIEPLFVRATKISS